MKSSTRLNAVLRPIYDYFIMRVIFRLTCYVRIYVYDNMFVEEKNPIRPHIYVVERAE